MLIDAPLSVHFVLKITPISRALDEWEVFLDNVNRKEIALRLLNFGLTNKDFQFIFIRFDQTWLDLISTHLQISFSFSPQGIGDIQEELKDEDRDKVKIVEIKKNA